MELSLNPGDFEDFYVQFTTTVWYSYENEDNIEGPI